jgi:hypothetical protein
MRIAGIIVESIQYQVISDTEAVAQFCSDFVASLVPRNCVACRGNCVTVAHFRPAGPYPSLKTILLPHSVHTISAFSLYHGDQVESLVFEWGSELPFIGFSTFQGLPPTSIFIPGSVSFIGTSGFADCYSAHSLVFDRNSSLLQFPSHAFSSLGSLASITILCLCQTNLRGCFSVLLLSPLCDI